MISLTSFTPALMALSIKKGASSVLAIIFAIVVLPVPGGPQSIIEGILPCSIAVRKMLPLPVRCCCPESSSSVVGLMRSASGMEGLLIFTFQSNEKLCRYKRGEIDVD
jgi:hypothetical protein